jgi:hypothetical protein
VSLADAFERLSAKPAAQIGLKQKLKRSGRDAGDAKGSAFVANWRFCNAPYRCGQGSPGPPAKRNLPRLIITSGQTSLSLMLTKSVICRGPEGCHMRQAKTGRLEWLEIPSSLVRCFRYCFAGP